MQPWAHADAEAEAPQSSGKQSQPPDTDPALQEPALLRSAEQLSLAEARALLDTDHYGLDKVFMPWQSVTLLHHLHDGRQ